MCHKAVGGLAPRAIGTAVMVGLALVVVGLSWVSLLLVLAGIGLLAVTALAVSR